MKHENRISDILNSQSQLVTELENLIRGLPDNNKITRLGNNCFTIRHSDLSDSLILSPEYYDFKVQYEKLIKIVNETEFTKLLDVLASIIKRKHYLKSGHNFIFHPEVINNLKNVL